MKSGILPMIRTKPLAESSRGASQRTAWVVMLFFIAGYALGGLQQLFGGSICYSLDKSQALDASGQHATGHQVHAGEPRHATWFQYDRLGLQRMAARLHLDGKHGSMHVADASDMVYTRAENYPLTQERAGRVVKHGMLAITVANHAYLDFALNWALSVRKAGMDSFMIAATDTRMLSALVTSPLVTGRHVWYMDTNISSGDVRANKQAFDKMGRAKTAAMMGILKLGIDVLFNDVDLVWLRSPYAFFERFPQADILTSTDHLMPTVTGESLESAGSRALNIGMMLLRHRPQVTQFVGNWTAMMINDPAIFDQEAFNVLANMPEYQLQAFQPPENLWKGFNRTVTFGVLPAVLFASGHMYFVQRKHLELGLQPYVVHATYQFELAQGKRHRFREGLLWDDAPQYYDHPKGFVHIKMDIPAHLLAAAAKPVVGKLTWEAFNAHFALVHHQLAQLRGGLAVASLTGRAIILPPFTCMLDRYWGLLLNGNLPLSNFTKPFACPADHLLTLADGWLDKPEYASRGPTIEYRAHSFLQHTRLPPAIKSSWMNVEVCMELGQAGQATCPIHTGHSLLKDAALHVMPNLDSSILDQALAPFKSVKILSIRNAAHIFDHFIDPQVQQQFEARLRHYTVANPYLLPPNGWVWYDMFAGVPHTDRIGRAFNETWVAYRGDSMQVITAKDFESLP